MQKTIYYLLNKFFMNEVENKILSYFKKINKKIVFDVGCYRGNFTTNFIKNEKRLGIESDFFLFDPNPNVKNYLKTILENKKVKFFNLALDSTNSEKTFYLNKFFEPSGSSLKKFNKEDKKWTGTRKLFFQILQPFKKVEDFCEINIQTQTLDNFCNKTNIESVDVLKIDTEGNELDVLQGAKNLLSEGKIKLIYVRQIYILRF